MPVYEYKAYSSNGKSTRGIVDAETSKIARQKLKKQGLSVYEIEEHSGARPSPGKKGPSKAPFSSFFSNRVGVKDSTMMTRQLASLIKSNIPLVEALTAMADQTTNETLKITLSQVRQDVNEGASLAKAMKKHPKIFDHIFVNMIEAGESSGTLGSVLLKLASLKEGQVRIRSKIKSGMTYPVIMLFVAFTLLIAIFTFVIPKLAAVFEGMNKKMPPLTVALMNISAFIVDYWFFLIIGIMAATFLFINYIRTPKGKARWHRFLLRVPVVGELVRMVAIARFASTMSSLLASGVPILSAMSISKNLVGNVLLEEAIVNARENITEGQSIAEPLRRSGQFPPMVTHMISIGEKTGELPEMLNNVAETYEEQASAKITDMTSLIEPVMLIFMGIIVGTIVLAVFIPLMDMSSIN